MAEREVTFYYDELLKFGVNYKDMNGLKGPEYLQAVLIKGSGSASVGTNIVARGLINESDFTISASNKWGKLEGVPLIGGTVASNLNSLRAKAAGMSVYAKKTVDVILNQAERWGVTDWVGDTLGIDSIQDEVYKFQNAVGNVTDFVNKASQNAIESADDFMRIFNGSEIEFPHQFTEYLVTDSYDLSKDGAVDVHELYLDRIKATIGRYSADGKTGGFIGYTTPPSGFRTSLDGLKNRAHPAGTFTLAFAHYFIRGLLVESVNAEVSTTKVKVENGKSKEIRPLYIKLTYNLTPAVKYSIDDLENRFNGK